MNTEFFSSLSLSAQEQSVLQEEILQGKFGRPGELFLTTRALAQLRNISVVTAHNVLSGLCSSGYIELRGKHYYLAYSELALEHSIPSHTIGMLLPQLNNEFYSSLADAVVSSCARAGYHVLLMNTVYSPAEEKSAFRTLVNYHAAGIINCDPNYPENEFLFRNSSIPCVILGHSLDRSRISSVQVNSFSIAQKVAQHLVEEGYRQFIYIGTKRLPLENDIRFTAFQMGLKQRGFTLNAADILSMEYESGSDELLLVKRLRDCSEPVGIFCYHDLLAMQVYRVCRKLGKSIPGEVGVVGFDDLSIAGALHPSLTTVQYRTATMADMAVNLLTARIRSADSPYDNYYIEPNLIIRRSSLLSEKKKTSKKHDT